MTDKDGALVVTKAATYTKFNGQSFVPPLVVSPGDVIVVLGATPERSTRIEVYGVDRTPCEERELVREQWLRVT